MGWNFALAEKINWNNWNNWNESVLSSSKRLRDRRLACFCSFQFDDSTSLYTAFCPFKCPLLAFPTLCFFGILLPWLHPTSQSSLLPQNLLPSLFAFSAPSSSRFAHAKPINRVTTRFLVGNPQYGSFDICKGKIFRTDPPGANHF